MWREVRRRGERGAVTVLVAVLLSVVMGVAAIVIDLGMLRVTGQDLQALADVVSLDLARELSGGRTQAELAAAGNFGNSSSAVRQSAGRNVDVFGEDVTLEVDWGSYTGAVWNTATEPPTAVKVVATARTDYAMTSGSGNVKRTAYAVAASSACYRLGTFVAAIRSGDSTVLGPLNKLLGVNLGLVSYRALADADVTIAQLAAAPSIGSPEHLLNGTVTFGDLLRATVTALSNQSGVSNSLAISVLQQVIAASGSVGSIAVRDVLHVAPTDTAALGIDLNVLDIVGSARLASGQHFLEIPNLQAGVPGVGFHFTGSIALISAAQLACGKPNSADSVARNTQLAGDLGVEFVNLPSLSIPGLATLQTLGGTGSFHVSVADGTGRLVTPPAVHCGSGTAADPHSYSVAVTTTPASYSLEARFTANGDVKVSVLNGLGLGGLLNGLLGLLLPTKVTLEAQVKVAVATNSPGGTSFATLRLPPNDVTPYQTGSTLYLNPANVVPTVTALKINGSTVALASAQPLVNVILSELTTAGNGFVQKTFVPLLDNFNNVLIGPVARMVGLRFGGADVYAVGAICGHPALRG